jgi:hypothetical protein
VYLISPSHPFYLQINPGFRLKFIVLCLNPYMCISASICSHTQIYAYECMCIYVKEQILQIMNFRIFFFALELCTVEWSLHGPYAYKLSLNSFI